ncbi:MAG TPA: acyltransferase, partial [Puia sp.]|nr:acyltransferase [Puia sp.]
MDTRLSPAIPGPARPVGTASHVRPEATRLAYIDNIRWVMIMLVLSMHAAVTYSGVGSWYYNEQAPVSAAEKAVFVTYQAFLQSFFMGLLFFIAGYFVPGAYDRKGGWRFLRDRAFRLGLPTLLYIVALQPLTVKLAYGHWGRIWVGGTGPLWFCAALLIFCLAYAVFRLLTPRRREQVTSFPGQGAIIAFIMTIAA